MSGQQSIKKFFKATNKRRNSLIALAQNTVKKNKQSEDDDEKENQDLEDNIGTSQKNRMKANKELVEHRMVQCRKTPALSEDIRESWFRALKSEFKKSYFEKLSKYLEDEWHKATVYPPKGQMYNWTHYCDIQDIRVVILGQDPYHGSGQAHGLCFSVPLGVPPPPSLLNIYKELVNDITGFKRPGHGYLAGWAKQGVLLLNACLSVRAHVANSHKDQGWEDFTSAVIKTVANVNENVVFLLWGAYAQKKAAFVDNKKHHLLHAPHPSPLSAHRGFLGCSHFSKCNEILKENRRTPIDWSWLPTDI